MRARSTSSCRCSRARSTRGWSRPCGAPAPAGWADRRRRDGGDGEARGADRDVSPATESTWGWSERRWRNGAPRLLTDLLARGYVPIVACIGATRDGQLLNVNADTLASHLAAALGARRLVIAGGTSGVLDEQGQTIARLTARDAARLIKAGTANKGMVAKLQACRAALQQRRRRRGHRQRPQTSVRHAGRPRTRR